MNSKTCVLAVTASLVIAAAVTARAAAGDTPASGLDLGAIKPKSDTNSATNPAGILPVGQSPLSKQKAATGTTATGGAGTTGAGTAIKSPLGTKGVLGGPATGVETAQPAQDDAASSNDVVVKLPSNVKK